MYTAHVTSPPNEQKRTRKHAKMPPEALARYEMAPRKRGDPPLDKLIRIERDARRLCGKLRVYGVLSMAQTQDLFFKHLLDGKRPLNPEVEADIRRVQRAIAYWRDVVGAVEPDGTGFRIRDFHLGSEECGFVTEAQMPAERRARRRVKSEAKQRARIRDRQHKPQEICIVRALPAPTFNVASYLRNGFTTSARPWKRLPRAPVLPPPLLSGLRFKAQSSRCSDKPDGRCSDIAQINLLIKDRQSTLNRKRLVNSHLDALSLEHTLLASPQTGVVLDTDLGSQASSVAASAPADAPKVAPDDLGLGPLLSLGGEQTPNIDCTGPEAMSLEDRLKRLAAMDDGLEDGLSAAEYTEAEHAADFGETCAQQTPRHGGMPTVPIVPGQPLTPSFMAQFKKQYPEFEGVNVRVLIRERLTQTHLTAAAAGTRRSKQTERRPGMLVHGARQLRDEVWGVRSDYLVGMR